MLHNSFCGMMTPSASASASVSVRAYFSYVVSMSIVEWALIIGSFSLNSSQLILAFPLKSSTDTHESVFSFRQSTFWCDRGSNVDWNGSTAPYFVQLNRQTLWVEYRTMTYPHSVSDECFKTCAVVGCEIIYAYSVFFSNNFQRYFKVAFFHFKRWES